MNLNVERFATSLKKKYKCRLINREKQWPCRQSSKLVRLQLVHRGKAEGSYTSIQGGKEDKRSPLAYCDLFKGESGKVEQVKKVLVEGGAGIGKTTLTISLSEDWACDKLFQEFELVLLLPLRHKKVASAGSLPELLKLLHSSPSVCESVSSYLEEEEAEKVLIIADGWDELSECERREGSFLYQLLFEQFSLMSVIVTSRPSASASLHSLPVLDRFVDIKGFNNEDIKEYIQSEFASDQEKAKRVLEQLECNPLIESVCSVPLNCAIVCHLWDTLEEALPFTMTQLYTKITLHVVCRNLRKLPAYGPTFGINSFDDLPEGLQESWWLLCKFAYEALDKNQLVFSKKEVLEFFPDGLAFNEQLLCFGLLQPVETVLDVTSCISFNFLHLTFMEYLAALHLSKLPLNNSCFKLFEKYDFSMVQCFFFGIYFNGSQSEAKIGDVRKVIQNIAGNQYCSDNLSLCHCAFEAQNEFVTSEIVQSLIKSMIVEIDLDCSGNSRDCAAVLYVVSNMKEWSFLKINFNNCGVTDNQIRKLADDLASKQRKLQIKELSLADNKLTDKTVRYLFERSSDAFKFLSYLDISDNKIGAEGIISITKALENTCTCSNYDLNLSGNPFEVSVLNTLKDVLHIRNLFLLQSLFLDRLLPDDAGANASWLTTFGEAILAYCPSFTTLGLSQNNLSVPGATALATVISRHQERMAPLDFDGSECLPLDSYTSLYLDETNLGDEGLCAFINNLDGLDGVCYFNKLHLYNNGIQATGVSCLADAVCSRKIVIVGEVYLSDNLLGLDGSLAVGRMLSSCHCKLSKIYLCGCKLTTESDLPPNNVSPSLGSNGCDSVSSKTNRDVEKQICEMSQSNTITLLVLDNNSFTGSGIHILVAFMYLCPNLKYLCTSSCEIKSNDLIQLFSTLSSQKSSFLHLERWKLGNNKIDNRGVSALIYHLPSLFTRLGCGRFGGIILNNNPAVTNEMKKRLKRELRNHIEVRCYYLIPPCIHGSVCNDYIVETIIILKLVAIFSSCSPPASMNQSSFLLLTETSHLISVNWRVMMNQTPVVRMKNLSPDLSLYQF